MNLKKLKDHPELYNIILDEIHSLNTHFTTNKKTTHKNATYATIYVEDANEELDYTYIKTYVSKEVLREMVAKLLYIAKYAIDRAERSDQESLKRLINTAEKDMEHYAELGLSYIDLYAYSGDIQLVNKFHLTYFQFLKRRVEKLTLEYYLN